MVGEVSGKWNLPNLMYIYHKQIMQKIQWNSWNGQLHFSALISLESVKVQGLSRHLSPETKAEHKESKRARQPRPGCWWLEASPRFWSGASRVLGWDAEVEVTLSKLRFRAISYPGNNICWRPAGSWVMSHTTHSHSDRLDRCSTDCKNTIHQLSSSVLNILAFLSQSDETIWQFLILISWDFLSGSVFPFDDKQALASFITMNNPLLSEICFKQNKN